MPERQISIGSQILMGSSSVRSGASLPASPGRRTPLQGLVATQNPEARPEQVQKTRLGRRQSGRCGARGVTLLYEDAWWIDGVWKGLLLWTYWLS